MTWGCAGPIKSGKRWIDGATRPYIEPERNDYLLRVKWFRRSLNFFWQRTKQRVGLAQCRPAGSAILSYVTCASVCWDEACFSRVDQWILTTCRTPCVRGSNSLRSLPLVTKTEGMALCGGLQIEGVRSN